MPLFGAFRLFLFNGRQPICIEERRKSPKIDADRCFAVLTELIFAQARQSPQGILSYFQGL